MITNGANAGVQFSNTSTAGNATITNSGTRSFVEFSNGSTAASATLINTGDNSRFSFELSHRLLCQRRKCDDHQRRGQFGR